MKGLLAAALLIVSASSALAAPPLELDHVMIYAMPGAPEKDALAREGFVIAPTVNRHDGQGTSSVTVEFVNGFLELPYPDPSVRISPALAAVAQKFKDRSNWRATGLSPFGLQFHRTAATPADFPFPTVKVHADWMAPTESIEMLTPREMTNALGLFIPPYAVDEAANLKLLDDPVKGAMFRHPNGARRITGVQVVMPSADRLPPAAPYVSDTGAAKFTVGNEWLMILTLDDGRQGKVHDFHPDLPLVIHY